MKRLSALDAAFLYIETPLTPTHVGSVTIFSPAAKGRDVYQEFRRHTAERLEALPSYRRRLVSTPLGLDHPSWAAGDDVDLDYHVRHLALPRPGSMAQLRELVARLHAVALDRSRPLWEYHVIEGLEDDGFAVYVKIHHSEMDGVAGTMTLDVIYDFAAEGAPSAANENKRALRAEPEPTDFIELTGSAVADLVRFALRAATSLPKVATTLAAAAPKLTRDARILYDYAKNIPRTPFNVTISGERVFATASLPLGEVKALAKSNAATINDVVMALSAGALRRYLLDKSALPAEPLAAAVPASLRASGDAVLNNQVVFTVSKVPTHIDAPLPRLAAARAAGQDAKTLFADLRDLMTTDVSIVGVPLIVSGIARSIAPTRAADRLPWAFNLVISNVPGPRMPMYCAGTPATHYYPLSVPYHGCALNITVQSYLDRLDFGLVACRRAVPDAQIIADYIVDDFRALREADARLQRPDAVEVIDISRPRAPRAPRLDAEG